MALSQPCAQGSSTIASHAAAQDGEGDVPQAKQEYSVTVCSQPVGQNAAAGDINSCSSFTPANKKPNVPLLLLLVQLKPAPLSLHNCAASEC